MGEAHSMIKTSYELRVTYLNAAGSLHHFDKVQQLIVCINKIDMTLVDEYWVTVLRKEMSEDTVELTLQELTNQFNSLHESFNNVLETLNTKANKDEINQKLKWDTTKIDNISNTLSKLRDDFTIFKRGIDSRAYDFNIQEMELIERNTRADIASIWKRLDEIHKYLLIRIVELEKGR